MRAFASLCVVMACAGSALAAKPFSHEVHVNNFEVRCNECHTQGPAGAPSLNRQVCLDCHDERAPDFVPAGTKPLTPAFPHQSHSKALDCLTCHQQVLNDARVRGQPVMPRQNCPVCHTRQNLKAAERRCEACHEGNQRLVRPQDHGGAWLQVHGQAADVRGQELHGRDCGLCHGTDACVRCHRERKPQSHTGLWDVRLHGVAASFDREPCKACHETGVCVRCHLKTRPMNHTAAWTKLHGLAAAATDNEHCRACHTPAQCTGCHRVGL